MALNGRYEPSAAQWVRDQVAEYEASNGERANTLRDTGQPVIIVTMQGKTSGTIRKIALMRVEHDGEYALVASQGGAPTHPSWYFNLVRHPDEIEIQDGPAPHTFSARQVEGDEKAQWWQRAVAAFPNYADYQDKTARVIPVLVATPKSS
jgi:deazaflavin-dependent oxidoreductase (nitroreductase family)